MSSYTVQRYIAIGISCVLAMIGAIQLANAETLGVSPRLLAWLAIVSVGLGILNGFLPSVQGRSRDPVFLADRIMDLGPSDRSILVNDVVARQQAEQAAQAPPVPRPLEARR